MCRFAVSRSRAVFALVVLRSGMQHSRGRVPVVLALASVAGPARDAARADPPRRVTAANAGGGSGQKR
jgi:hypothetical protein